jgi:hypothetical protein
VRPGSAFGASRAVRGLLALTAGALLALPGCGGGGDDNGQPIPRNQADQMIGLIRLADKQSGEGTCNGAKDKVRRAAAIADQLPRSVDADVRRGIVDGLQRLQELVSAECLKQEPQPTETQTVTTETQTIPTQTETDTTPTETQPTQTDTTPTQTDTTPTDTTPTTTTGTGGGVGPGTTTGAAVGGDGAAAEGAAAR